MERSSGIILHITSLPSPYGIGTLGKEAFAFVDFLAQAGQRYWQLLPIGPTGFGDSPYQPFSAFAGNPYMVDLELLCEEGLLTESELSQALLFDGRQVDFAQQYHRRYPLLRKAFGRFSIEPLEDFAKARPEVAQYALFMALKDDHQGAPYTLWDPELIHREPEALAAAAARLKEDVDFYLFLQYEFFQQFFALKEYAAQKGVRLIGDVPIYLPPDCAELWSQPELFLLDEDGRPAFVAGVPPDYFSEDGQLWGNPLYDWPRHQADGFAWWRRRLRAAFELFDGIRLDHFRGFADYWSVPAGEKTAKNGRWLDGPGMAFVNAVKEEAQGRLIIAEDLGDLSEKARKLLFDSGFPGMKVLQFAFGSGPYNAYLPHNYNANCVCYPGTHDNDTTAGWLKTLDPHVKEQLELYAGSATLTSLLRLGAGSVAELFVVQLQDYLDLDSDCRMNTPGVSGGNWGFRLLKGELTGALAEKIRTLTQVFGR